MEGKTFKIVFKNFDDTEDFVSETFIKEIEKYGEYDENRYKHALINLIRGRMAPVYRLVSLGTFILVDQEAKKAFSQAAHEDAKNEFAHFREIFAVQPNESN